MHRKRTGCTRASYGSYGAYAYGPHTAESVAHGPHTLRRNWIVAPAAPSCTTVQPAHYLTAPCRSLTFRRKLDGCPHCAPLHMLVRACTQYTGPATVTLNHILGICARCLYSTRTPAGSMRFGSGGACPGPCSRSGPRDTAPKMTNAHETSLTKEIIAETSYWCLHIIIIARIVTIIYQPRLTLSCQTDTVDTDKERTGEKWAVWPI